MNINKQNRFCVECKKEVSLFDNYCTKCGSNEFMDNYSRCSNCNHIYRKVEKFCYHCGHELAKNIIKQYKWFKFWDKK